MKNERQARILEVIKQFDVHTQDEITEILKREGFKVTQATVSRDLKELKLMKSMSSTGKYRYVSHASYDQMSIVKLNATMLGSIVGVRYSMNDVVIKTFPGLAQAVASSVDAMNMSGILGCVAGDDTIIIVTKNEESSANISARIKELIKTL